MSVIQTKRLMPVDLSVLPERNAYELVNGELVERNGSVLSSHVAGRLMAKLSTFCQTHAMGGLLGSCNGIGGFPDNPNKIRKPDFSFVKRDRFTAVHLHQEFLAIAPDL